MNVAKLLKAKKSQILEDWMNSQIADVGLRDDLMSNEELRIQSQELLDTLLKVLTDSNIRNTDSPDFEPVNELLAGISISRARRGFSPRETGVYIFSLKDAFLTTIKTEFMNEPAVLIEAALDMNRLMDSFGVTTFETFIKGREEVILRQTHEISEISTPVIKVWEGILALPIIGTLDSARTQVVMENLLVRIVETGSTVAILDISGVPTVDSLVAQHLIKTVAATRLMGADCIISGIRPEIAQTVVHLGIDLTSITTKATLASALRYAFSTKRLEVKKTAN